MRKQPAFNFLYFAFVSLREPSTSVSSTSSRDQSIVLRSPSLIIRDGKYAIQVTEVCVSKYELADLLQDFTSSGPCYI